ncbi:MAG: type VI secretion system tip protein TssI/VgrG [Polyangiaceae bacterium]
MGGSSEPGENLSADFTLIMLGRMFASEPYVLSVHGTERANAVYAFEVRVALDPADDIAADDSLLQMPVLLQILGGDQPRFLHGIVLEIAAEGGAYQRRRIFRLLVGPRLALLKQRRFCRIFTDKSALEIVKTLLDEHRVPYRLRITAAYAARAYTVQYQETDYAFVRRLLSESGIFFTFDHPSMGGANDGTNMGGSEVLVLGDTAQSYSPIEGTSRLDLKARADAMLKGDSCIHELTGHRRARPTATLERAFDFRRPTVDIRDAAGTASPQMVYSFGGEGDESPPDLTPAAVRLEQERREAFTAVGSSACRRLMPGRTMQLDGHEIGSLSGGYVVKEVEHAAYAGDATPPNTPRYSNRFVCIQATAPLRPKRRRSAARHLTETATVVGPRDKEIHTDGFGRVRVQFHWDLAGARDGAISTWLRVEQGWAGAGWGAQILPRVGMEVVVTFLGGDVDRPLITGCVYNATHPLPFPQPAELAKAGLRSQTTPGGGGFHEISIDDTKDAELLFVRAQRDQKRLVGNDDEEVIQHDQRSDIRHDRTATIAERDRIDAGKEHTVTVGGVAPQGRGGGGGGGQGTFTMNGGNASLDVSGNISMHAAGNAGLSADGDISISAGGTVSVDGADVLVSGKSTVVIKGGHITIDGGDVVVKGGTITQN